MAAKNATIDLMDLAGSFVVKKKGAWNHDDWEKLLGQAEKLGMPQGDEAKRNLGNMLEAGQYFYNVLPALPAKAKAKGKTKAKAKAKGKTKAKAKGKARPKAK
jgi:hypothetical protein